MNSRTRISTVAYLICYLIFVVITVIAFNEFWTTNSKHGNFIYTIFFVCFLETLMTASAISANVGLFERMEHNQNLILVLESIFVLYLVGSIILLYVGNIYYSDAPSLLFLLTIGYTLLFTLVIIWYWNRIASDSEIDKSDKHGRIERIELVSKFEKAILSYNSINGKINEPLKKLIDEQLDILKMRLKNLSPSRGNDSTRLIENDLYKNLENVNSFIVAVMDEKVANVSGIEILTELELLKENILKREAMLKK